MACCAISLVASGVDAQAQPTADLIQKLDQSADFRVRVQAALELGKTHGTSSRRALESALDDENAAVRAAAAAGLKVMRDPEALPALRRHEHDGSPAVRAQIHSSIAALEGSDDSTSSGNGSRTPDVMVQVGKIRGGNSTTSGEMLDDMARTSKQKLRELPGVGICEEGKESRRGVPVVMVTGRVKQLEESREGSNVVYMASIEFVLHKMPGQTIKGVVSGSARASGSVDELADLRRSAIEAAIDSAVRRAPAALRAAAQ